VDRRVPVNGSFSVAGKMDLIGEQNVTYDLTGVLIRHLTVLLSPLWEITQGTVFLCYSRYQTVLGVFATC
jgi:hypothetical protein